MTGCEALLRWRHPERGMISPAEFIPVAEDTGLIVELGEWVLRTACAEAATWPDHIRVAVNVSPVQLKCPTLALKITGALAASGLAANRLELEITEAVLIRDDETALAILHQLRAIGVRIALDDFGTGYSSLSYLKRFPFDKIKIDRCFVSDIAEIDGSSAIVQAVVNIAAARNMTTTAEGVETAEQKEMLRALGCTEMQGYLFSAAKPGAEVRHLFGFARERRPSLARSPARAFRPGATTLRRQPAAIVLGEDRADQPAETLGLLVVQIAGQAERMAAGVDELLQRVGALRGIADDGDAGAGPDLGDAGPQMRQQQIAMLAGELLHALVGLRLVVERLHLLLLPLGGVAHQDVGGLPGVPFVLAADHLQAHAEADRVFATMGPRHLPDLGDVRGDPLRQVAPEQMHVGMLRRHFPGLRASRRRDRISETAAAAAAA